MKKDQKTRWNFAAQQFDQLPIPQWGSDPFLKLLEDLPVWGGDSKMLDLGCGAGRYTIAMAPRCQLVVGSDIAEDMVNFTNRKKELHQADNVTFRCEDWENVDLQTDGYEKQFDLVVAHMTPALSSLEALEKMDRSSKGYCAMAAHYKREDPLQEELQSLLGIQQRKRSKIPEFFSYLYERGKCPQVSYYFRDDSREMAEEEAVQFWKNRMMFSMDLTMEQEREIERFVSRHTQNGRLNNPVRSTIVAMIWKSKEERNE